MLLQSLLQRAVQRGLRTLRRRLHHNAEHDAEHVEAPARGAGLRHVPAEFRAHHAGVQAVGRDARGWNGVES